MSKRGKLLFFFFFGFCRKQIRRALWYAMRSKKGRSRRPEVCAEFVWAHVVRFRPTHVTRFFSIARPLLLFDTNGVFFNENVLFQDVVVPPELSSAYLSVCPSAPSSTALTTLVSTYSLCKVCLKHVVLTILFVLL